MRALGISLAALFCLALPVEMASACTCAGLKPKAKYSSAKAAFIGKVVEKELLKGEGVPFQSVHRYRIEVQRSFKRKLGEHIAIKASNDDATCGFEWDVGERVAAYLYGKRGNWNTSVCLLERPGTLRRVARKVARDSVSRQPRSPRSPCR